MARGDLGVEMPLEQVPGLQKRITRLARRLGKPVVVATQMLESMISAPVPTRAEVSDVATAVFDGADAIMLSAESAAGRYPAEAVATMNRIAEEVERDGFYRAMLDAQRGVPEATGADAIAVATRDVAETLDMKAIVAWTCSGSTAFRIARERPRPPILALTPNASAARRLAIVWGVHPIVTKDAHDIDDMSKRACKFAGREGCASAGDRIVHRRRRALRDAGRDQQHAHLRPRRDGRAGGPDPRRPACGESRREGGLSPRVLAGRPPERARGSGANPAHVPRCTRRRCRAGAARRRTGRPAASADLRASR